MIRPEALKQLPVDTSSSQSRVRAGARCDCAAAHGYAPCTVAAFADTPESSQGGLRAMRVCPAHRDRDNCYGCGAWFAASAAGVRADNMLSRSSIAGELENAAEGPGRRLHIICFASNPLCTRSRVTSVRYPVCRFATCMHASALSTCTRATTRQPALR